MKRRSFWKMPAVATAFALAFALVVTGCPNEVTPDAAWQVTADSATNTMALHFVFNRAVTLTYEDIDIFGPVSAARNAAGDVLLTGEGRTWVLPILIGADGEVRVTINRSGIARASQTVAVGAADAAEWRVESNFVELGATPADTNISTTALRLDFDAPQQGLTLTNFVVLNRDGEVDVTGIRSGIVTRPNDPSRVWYLDVTVEQRGMVDIFADIPGVRPVAYGGASVEVRPVEWRSVFNPLTNGIDIQFDLPVTITGADIELVDVDGIATAGELTGAGRFWFLPVTVNRDGNVWIRIDSDGIYATQRGDLDMDLPPITGFETIDWDLETTDCETMLRFEFSFDGDPIPVPLAVADINIEAIEGAATRGTTFAANSGGAVFYLPITVTIEGEVLVTISRSGVAEEAANIAGSTNDYITVSFPAPIEWEAEADGGGGEGTTTEIMLMFESDVDALVFANIEIFPVTGAATMVASTADAPNPARIGGRLWRLAVTPTAGGDVNVVITRDGICGDPQPATVAIEDIGWTAARGVGDTTPYIVLNLDAPVTALTVGANGVSFTDGRPGEDPIGADWDQGRVEAVSGATGAPRSSLGGRRWEVPITVVEAGWVRVSLNVAGFANTIAPVEVELEEVYLNEWSAMVIEDEDGNTVAIALEFEEPVDGLLATQVIINRGTVNAALGAFVPNASNGRLWTLNVTSVTATQAEGPVSGTVYITIVRPGIYQQVIQLVVAGEDIVDENAFTPTPLTNPTAIRVVFDEALTAPPSGSIVPSTGPTENTGLSLGTPVGGGIMWTFPVNFDRTAGNFPGPAPGQPASDITVNLTIGGVTRSVIINVPFVPAPPAGGGS